MASRSSDNPLAYAGAPGRGRIARDARRRIVGAPGEPPALRDLALFAGVSEATLSRLSHEAKVEHVEDGDAIFRQGDAADAVVIVLQGYVKILRIAPNGDETLVGIRTDGETVSDPTFGADDLYGFSAEAVGMGRLLKLQSTRFARTMKESPDLCAAAVRDARVKIAGLIAEIESLKGLNADQRLARFLLSLCPPNAEQCRFRLPYDKRLIALQLGIKQETLSRAFAKLRDHGVRTETRDVLIESVSRLAQQCACAARPAPDARPAHEDAA